jgi:hypothetical protein
VGSTSLTHPLYLHPGYQPNLVTLLNLDSKLLEILVIFKIGIYRLTDDFGAFFSVFLFPLRVFDFDGLIFLFLVEGVSFMLKIKDGWVKYSNGKT